MYRDLRITLRNKRACKHTCYLGCANQQGAPRSLANTLVICTRACRCALRTWQHCMVLGSSLNDANTRVKYQRVSISMHWKNTQGNLEGLCERFTSKPSCAVVLSDTRHSHKSSHSHLWLLIDRENACQETSLHQYFCLWRHAVRSKTACGFVTRSDNLILTEIIMKLSVHYIIY